MSSDLLTRERQEAIRSELRQSGRVLAGDLARHFKVSEDTIRRDLRDMAAAGLCERVYGGALALPSEQPFSVRTGISRGRKQALAAAAVTRLTDGMTVFVDAGSTNLAIVKALPPGLCLTLATNMPAIAAAALDHGRIEVITIGGRIDRHVGAAIGTQAERDLKMLRPDLCILGACGIDAGSGLTGLIYDDVVFKTIAAAHASAVLVACTTDKLGLVHPFVIAALDARMTLTLEADAPDTLTTALQATGASVLHAQPVAS
ncbi:DeoR family transcriptional regulator [Rhizobium sp. Leaf384]|uniref:DeoR/GlpR family DNA-binding transcription regulator n=1 Tax=unclassified Rhizobium TaxID=2613769 RepID=UPI00071469AD|nr:MULTISPECIES: DeoR/GlpR family DNA-binding transcription regulator [unclassified Rhizobium]KQS76173.1 DeoR family transcriptional regulator [Rhizobium sp. Leaf384]KQS78557.1 DeoR family transcriptional regulator [Rhizobium sp. Leaf383]